MAAIDNVPCGRYLRFRTRLRHPDCPAALGVFAATGDLLDADVLDASSARLLDEICQWFNDHLFVPELAAEH